MRLSFLLALLVFASGCTLFDEPTERSQRSVAKAVVAFQQERERYPQDLAELQEFAAGRMSLDTSPFTIVRFEHPAPEALRIHLISESPDNISVILSYKTEYQLPPTATELDPLPK